MPDRQDRPLPEHVTTPLLTLITEHSLDDDYAEVARRRDTTETAPRGRSAWVAAAVVTVFGVLAATAAVQTSRNQDTEDAGRATLIAKVRSERAALDRQEASIASLQRANIELEDARAEVGADQRTTDARLRRLETVTGYGATTGPGVRIVVDDAPGGDLTQLVRDEDLALLDTTHGQQFFDLADDLGFEYAMKNESTLTLPAAPGPRLRHVEAGTGEGDAGQQEVTP